LTALSPAADDGAVDAPRTARARARVELTARILEVAGRHLATEGAAGLSLRAVARELGMSSSAVYRYVASRDELLTALIIQAYDDLGEAVEAAEAGADRADHLGRWLAASRAVRAWAGRHPQRYALVYGTPVPGYEAPADTIAPATRATAAFASITVDAVAAGALAPPPEAHTDALPPTLEADAAALADQLFPGVPTAVVVQAVVAWTAVFGLVSFELFGQYRNTLHDGDAFFDHTATALGRSVGLRPA
jgi:AcrR family transcriptional regulator